jgi:hypothetical protein
MYESTEVETDEHSDLGRQLNEHPLVMDGWTVTSVAYLQNRTPYTRVYVVVFERPQDDETK